MSVLRRVHSFSFSVRALAIAMIALSLVTACSASDPDFQTRSIPSIAPPSLNPAQLATLAAFRSVCLGTSLDQRGAVRALYVLGYELAGEDGETGERRYVKGQARVLLSSAALRSETAAVSDAQATALSATEPGRARCVVAHDDLGRGEATAILGEAIRGAGLLYRPGTDGRAIVEGSDYTGVASVLRTLGGSGLSLTKSPRALD